MITRTFSFLKGFSPSTEQRLKSVGVNSWDDFLKSSEISLFSSEKKKLLDEEITKAKRNLEAKNHLFFYHNLPNNEHWRLFKHFKDDCCYVDIETTGLSSYTNSITTISIWDNKEVKTFINGQNLDEESLKSELSKYKMIVTFNGKTFDLPFICRKFPGICFDIPHIDLRWVGRKAGLSGGLKNIEKEVGISRGEDVANIDGSLAVRLWKRWERQNDKDALDLLVRYNQEDVINLEKLMEITYERLSKTL